MTRERFLYVYAHANSLAELALKAALADADAWMESGGPSASSDAAADPSAGEREAAESLALESAFDGLDMNALDGLPFFGADEADGVTAGGDGADQADQADQADGAERAEAVDDSAPTSDPVPPAHAAGSKSELAPPSESGLPADSPAETPPKLPAEPELALYLDQLYGKLESIQRQSDALLSGADTRKLHALLARQDRDLPAIDQPWRSADLNDWLERYLASDPAIDALVVWIRGLASSLDGAC